MGSIARPFGAAVKKVHDRYSLAGATNVIGDGGLMARGPSYEEISDSTIISARCFGPEGPFRLRLLYDRLLVVEARLSRHV